jgi:hypothetical protein
MSRRRHPEAPPFHNRREGSSVPVVVVMLWMDDVSGHVITGWNMSSCL